MRSFLRFALTSGMAVFTANVSADEVPGTEHKIEYNLTIAGISIGDAGMLIVPRSPGLYQTDVNLSFQFLFWSGEGQGTSFGRVTNASPVPASYDLIYMGSSEPMVIKTAFDDEGPTEWSITPPPKGVYLTERIPVKNGDLKGAIDPISAMVIRAETANDACNRTLRIFSGATRLNLALSPGIETVSGVFTCDVRYEPVSGHRKGSESVARLMESGPILSIFEVAPGLWAPHRVGLPTSVGTLAIVRAVPKKAN
jgi:hypothetical protein